MRKSTIVSLLILCGSTAALAQVTPADPQQTANNTTLSNDAPVEPMPAPGNETTSPAPPPADNAVMTNEMSPTPKPM